MILHKDTKPDDVEEFKRRIRKDFIPASKIELKGDVGSTNALLFLLQKNEKTNEQFGQTSELEKTRKRVKFSEDEFQQMMAESN